MGTKKCPLIISDTLKPLSKPFNKGLKERLSKWFGKPEEETEEEIIIAQSDQYHSEPQQVEAQEKPFLMISLIVDEEYLIYHHN